MSVARIIKSLSPVTAATLQGSTWVLGNTILKWVREKTIMNGQEHCKAVAMENEIQVLQHLLNESRFTLVITGAGISVSAGIPSMHGLNLAETMQFISVRLLKSAPEHYYKVARHSFLDAIFGNGPTIAHTKLAELETEGKIQGIITTNLDGLHSLAGSKNVAEIQGSFGVNICLNCGKRKDDIRIWNQGKAPRCECGGLYCCYPVYSHVGLLQEAVKKAQSWASQTELVIFVGAQGMYGSVYWNYVRPSAKIVQINPGKTQFDSCAALNIREKADAVFSQLK